MTVFAALLFILLVIAIYASILIYLSPLLIGLIIIAIVNTLFKKHHQKSAPIVWIILTIFVIILSSILLWKGINSNAPNIGSLSFVILIAYGFISLCIFALPIAARQSKEKKLQKLIKKGKYPASTAYHPTTQPTPSPSGRSSSDNTPDWKLKERWEDYPMPNYDDIHTYCLVSLKETGKSFYYRTRNPDLKVGDTVFVPFGYQYTKKIGTIIKIKKVNGYNAPYPLGKTKFIIGKAE